MSSSTGRNASSFLVALWNCWSIIVCKPAPNFLPVTISDGAVSLLLAVGEFGLRLSRMCSTWDLCHDYMISAARMALDVFAPSRYCQDGLNRNARVRHRMGRS